MYIQYVRIMATTCTDRNGLQNEYPTSKNCSLTDCGLVPPFGDIDLGQLPAPSHFLNQCWLIASEVFWYSTEDNFTVKAENVYPWYDFEIAPCKITAYTVISSKHKHVNVHLYFQKKKYNSKVAVVCEGHCDAFYRSGVRLNIKMSLYQYMIHIIKIRLSYDRLIFIMEITIPGKTIFILRRAPCTQQKIFTLPHVLNISHILPLWDVLLATDGMMSLTLLM